MHTSLMNVFQYAVISVSTKNIPADVFLQVNMEKVYVLKFIYLHLKVQNVMHLYTA